MAKSETSSLVPIKVLETHGKSVLVEYVDGEMPYRSRVDLDEIVDGECSAERLRDVPYGIDWSGLAIDGAEMARRIEFELKKNKIWTYEDLQSRDRALIRISTNGLGRLVWDVAKKACKHSNS